LTSNPSNYVRAAQLGSAAYADLSAFAPSTVTNVDLSGYVGLAGFIGATNTIVGRIVTIEGKTNTWNGIVNTITVNGVAGSLSSNLNFSVTTGTPIRDDGGGYVTVTTANGTNVVGLTGNAISNACAEIYVSFSALNYTNATMTLQRAVDTGGTLFSNSIFLVGGNLVWSNQVSGATTNYIASGWPYPTEAINGTFVFNGTSWANENGIVIFPTGYYLGTWVIYDNPQGSGVPLWYEWPAIGAPTLDLVIWTNGVEVTGNAGSFVQNAIPSVFAFSRWNFDLTQNPPQLVQQTSWNGTSWENRPIGITLVLTNVPVGDSFMENPYLLVLGTNTSLASNAYDTSIINSNAIGGKASTNGTYLLMSVGTATEATTATFATTAGTASNVVNHPLFSLYAGARRIQPWSSSTRAGLPDMGYTQGLTTNDTVEGILAVPSSVTNNQTFAWTVVSFTSAGVSNQYELSWATLGNTNQPAYTPVSTNWFVFGTNEVWTSIENTSAFNPTAGTTIWLRQRPLTVTATGTIHRVLVR
jgi:hypothetical protein